MKLSMLKWVKDCIRIMISLYRIRGHDGARGTRDVWKETSGSICAYGISYHHNNLDPQDFHVTV